MRKAKLTAVKPLKVAADLHHAMKVHAVTEGRQLIDVTNEAVRAYLQRVSRSISERRSGSGGEHE